MIYDYIWSKQQQDQMNYIQKQKEYQKQVQQDQKQFDRIYMEKQKNQQIEQIPKLIKQFYEKEKDYTQMISNDLKEKIKNQKQNQISYYNIVSQDTVSKKNSSNSSRNFKSIHQGEYGQLKKHFSQQIQLSDFEKEIYMQQLDKMVKEHDMPIHSIYQQYVGLDDTDHQKQWQKLDQKVKQFDEDGLMIQELDKWKKNKRIKYGFKDSLDRIDFQAIHKTNSFIGKPSAKLVTKRSTMQFQGGFFRGSCINVAQRSDQNIQQQLRKDQNILSFLKRKDYQYTFDDYQKDQFSQKYQLFNNENRNNDDNEQVIRSDRLEKQELDQKIQEYCEQYPKMNSIYESLLKKTNLEIKMKLDDQEEEGTIKESIQIKDGNHIDIQLMDKICLTQEQYMYLQKNQEQMKISIKQLIKIQENENQELIQNFNQKIRSLQNQRLQLDNRIRNTTQMNSHLYIKLNGIQQAAEEQQQEIDEKEKKPKKNKVGSMVDQSGQSIQMLSTIEHFKQRQSRIEEKGSINVALERCKLKIYANQQLIKQNTNQKMQIHQRLQVIQRSFTNLLLQILKKGSDVRTQGLVWLLDLLKKQGVKIEMQVLGETMPRYLDSQSIKYLFEYFELKQSLNDVQYIQQTQLNFYQMIYEQDQKQQNYLALKLEPKSEQSTQMSTMQTNVSRVNTYSQIQRIEEEEDESISNSEEMQSRRYVNTDMGQTQFSYFQNIDLKNSVQLDNQNRSNYKYLNPIEIKNDQIQLCDNDHLNFWVQQNNRDKSNLFEKTFQQVKNLYYNWFLYWLIILEGKRYSEEGDQTVQSEGQEQGLRVEVE